MKIAYKNPKTYFVMGVDTALLCVAYFSAYWLKFDELSPTIYQNFFNTLTPVIVCQLVLLTFYDLHSGMWRYTSVVDLVKIIKAMVIAFVVFNIAGLYYYYPDLSGRFSRSVFILDTINAICLVSFFRLMIRQYYAQPGLTRLHPNRLFFLGGNVGKESTDSIPALIYGATERGELLLRSLQAPTGDGAPRYDIVGFIDDDPSHSWGSIHGCPVLGSFSELEGLIPRFSIQELLIASRPDQERLEQVILLCKQLSITCRVVPGYFAQERGEVSAEHLRAIQIEDLLFREPVTVDYSGIEATFSHETILVTGAGGSIGGELSRQLAAFGPKRLALVDKTENSLHELELLLKPNPDTQIDFYCVDVTNREKMAKIFAQVRPAYVLHAAAHKHVPMMERNKDEAIRNNVLGIKVVADLAEQYGVKKFTLISTDKAVDPVNIMGATKRVCELYLKQLSRSSKTTFMAVRFGNVLGSNGSVAPLFIRQIEERGPVTVTHPEVRRYFMTIHEAVLLILQAVSFGEQGELFLLDMGEPVKIVHLAEKMIEIAGFVPHQDIAIEFIGLRPGEKLDEELTLGSECMEPTPHPKVNRIIEAGRPWEGVEHKIDNWVSECMDDPEKVSAEIISWLGGAITSNRPND